MLDQLGDGRGAVPERWRRCECFFWRLDSCLVCDLRSLVPSKPLVSIGELSLVFCTFFDAPLHHPTPYLHVQAVQFLRATCVRGTRTKVVDVTQCFHQFRQQQAFGLFTPWRR